MFKTDKGIGVIALMLAPIAIIYITFILVRLEIQQTGRQDFIDRWSNISSLIAARASLVLDENMSVDDSFASDLYFLPSFLDEIEAIVLVDEQNNPVFSAGQEIESAGMLARSKSVIQTGDENISTGEGRDRGYIVFSFPVTKEGRVIGASLLAVKGDRTLYNPGGISLSVGVRFAILILVWGVIVVIYARRKSKKTTSQEVILQTELQLAIIGHSARDPKELALDSLKLLVPAIKLRDSLIYLMDKITGEIVPFSFYSATGETKISGNKVLDPADPRLVALAEALPRFYRLSKAGRAQSIDMQRRLGKTDRLAIPVLAAGDTIGLLDVGLGAEIRMNRAVMETLRNLTARIGDSLHAALERTYLNKQLLELHELVDAVEIIDSSVDLSDALRKITKSVLKTRNVRFCRVFAIDESGINLELLAESWAGEGADVNISDSKHKLDEMPLHKIAILSGKSQVIKPDEVDKQIVSQRDIYRDGMDNCVIMITPLSSSDRPHGCISVGVDNSSEFPMELKTRLENLAQHLSASLSNAQTCTRLKRSFDELRFDQSRAVLSERLDAVIAMARGICDSLETVLASMRERAESIKALSSDQNAISASESIEMEVEKYGEIAKRLRLFADVRGDGDFQQVELAQLLGEVAEEMKKEFGESERYRNKVKITASIVGSGQIYGYRDGLKSMIREIVRNSAEAMPDGGEIVVETGIEHYEAILTISDSGVGMTDDVRKMIFEPFFTLRKGLGRGLGMSMVHGIVTAHSGSIKVISGENSGCKTIIKMPLVDREQTALYNLKKGTDRNIPLSIS
jgi:signal transduction histidine kinase